MATGKRFYAVIYEGVDPIMGSERRRWHAAGTDRDEVERLAIVLATEARANARSAGLSLVNRSSISVAYQLHETRGKTRNSRRWIDLDVTTVTVLARWRDRMREELSRVVLVGNDMLGVLVDLLSVILPHATTTQIAARLA